MNARILAPGSIELLCLVRRNTLGNTWLCFFYRVAFCFNCQILCICCRQVMANDKVGHFL